MQHRVYLRPASLIAALALTVAMALPTFAMPRQQKHDYKQQVETLEEQWRVTQLANDTGAMDKMLSDDFIGISITGQIYTKAQQLERMRTKKLMLTEIRFDEMKVKLIGAIAIVTSRADIEGFNDDVPVKGTYRYTRVYKRLPSGAWKITSFEATRVPKPKDPPGDVRPSSGTPQTGHEPQSPRDHDFVSVHRAPGRPGAVLVSESTPMPVGKVYGSKKNPPRMGRFSQVWRRMRVKH